MPNPRHEFLSARRRAALALFGVVLALIVAEAAVRVFPIGQRLDGLYRSPRVLTPGGIPIRPLSRDLFTYKPHSSFSCAYDPRGDVRGYFKPNGVIDYRINGFGFRGPEIEARKKPGTTRLLCLGDSFTFGEGVREADTYPVRLEAMLNGADGDAAARGAATSMSAGQQAAVGDTATANTGYEVINAGIQAFDTRLEAEMLTRMLSFKPDVVLLGFVLNDAMEGSETIRMHGAMEADSIAHALSGPARVSRLWRIFERSARARRLQGKYLREIRASFESERWREDQAELKHMRELGEAQGFRFVVVIFPMLWDLDRRYPFKDLHAEVRRACAEAGCECFDLLPVFRGRPAEGLWAHPTDQHPNEIAHRIAAEAIAGYLRNAPTPGNEAPRSGP